MKLLPFLLLLAVAARATAATCTKAKCCAADVVGMCSGNKDAATDITCDAGTVLKPNPSTIAGTTKDACCTRRFCTLYDCYYGHKLKANAATTLPEVGVEPTDEICCEPRTGICAGNAADDSEGVDPFGDPNEHYEWGDVCERNTWAWSDGCWGTVNGVAQQRKEMTCDQFKKTPASASACCQSAPPAVTGKCTGNTNYSEDVACASGETLKENAKNIAAGTGDAASKKANCCEKNTFHCNSHGEDQVTFDCGDGFYMPDASKDCRTSAVPEGEQASATSSYPTVGAAVVMLLLHISC